MAGEAEEVEEEEADDGDGDMADEEAGEPTVASIDRRWCRCLRLW